MSSRMNITYYIKLGLKSIDADQGREFVGDIMWTIEPAIVIGTPFLLTSKEKDGKEKKD